MAGEKRTSNRACKKERCRDVIVAGGGAAGLLAAGRAAQRGCDVLLLEKMGQTARKIGISGKGRCNLTNSADLEEFITHFGKNGRFLRQCFRHFFAQDIINLLEESGVPIVLERGGRYFPKSGKAMDIVRALTAWARRQGAEILRNTPVEKICCENSKVTGVLAQGRLFPCTNLIVATGGKSYPRTGSTGDGYSLLSSVGLEITPLSPALVPLYSSYPYLSALSQLSVKSAGQPSRETAKNALTLRNITVRLFVDGKRKRQEFGEAAFIDGKIAGAVPLTLSGEIVKCLMEGKKAELRLDLKPALDNKKLLSRLQRDIEKRHKEPLATFLRGILPAPLISPCLAECALMANSPASSLKAKERQRIASWIKDMRLEITGFSGWDEAIITNGGVRLSEIDPQTMQSKRIGGLYVAGELLDLQADTGGYNLQAAFSTGWLAGTAVSQKKEI